MRKKRPLAATAFCAALLTSGVMTFTAGAGLAEGNDAPQFYSAGNQSSASSSGEVPVAAADKGIWYDLSHRDALLSDMGGVRPWLGHYGVTLGITETSEIFNSARGGVERGSDYEGLTTVTLQLDTKKAFGWGGGLFNVSGLDIHGSNFSAKKLDDLQTASGIEADNTARLWELWYQQSFWNGRADVKIGQQSLDQEFMVSNSALLFANTMFGWPMIPSVDMIGGGPAYPLSSPGVRLRGQVGDHFMLLGGVFNDNPSGLCPTCGNDPQRLNDRGTNFRLSDDPLFIAEIQYSSPGNGAMQRAGESDTLPGTYRLGAWYDAGQFADQEYGTDGLNLNLGNGDPRIHRGNWSIYAVADQMIWRPNAESGSGLSVFTRIMGAPPDRNLINFSANAGLTYKGLIKGRDGDTLGIGYGLANISPSVSNLERQSGTFPVQSKEQFIEVTYQAQVLPWIRVQPDFQYVFNPGAGVTNPNDLTNTIRLKDEAIIGIRTNITF